MEYTRAPPSLPWSVRGGLCDREGQTGSGATGQSLKLPLPCQNKLALSVVYAAKPGRGAGMGWQGESAPPSVKKSAKWLPALGGVSAPHTVLVCIKKWRGENRGRIVFWGGKWTAWKQGHCEERGGGKGVLPGSRLEFQLGGEVWGWECLSLSLFPLALNLLARPPSQSADSL